jgi:CO/xanthine dehydrogenase FAD-binding subunit
MIDYEYHRPSTLEEAVDLINTFKEKAKLLAGGTEVVNEMRFGKSKPEQLVDIKHINELDYIRLSSDGLKFGALYRLRDVECSKPL